MKSLPETSRSKLIKNSPTLRLLQFSHYKPEDCKSFFFFPMIKSEVSMSFSVPWKFRLVFQDNNL